MIFQQADDIHAGQTLFESEGFETHAVEARQTIMRAEPHIAVLGLDDGVHRVAGSPDSVPQERMIGACAKPDKSLPVA